ncbi:MAG TPA: RcnB family protein [Acidobacteriaceae bacterium]|jgi:Ni/Co efflux regulator RcnB|nr:RcnB family protein [Acidobacteriaceae bacterium]
MNALAKRVVVATLSIALTGAVAFAQDHPQDHAQDHPDHAQAQDHNSHYVRHNDWKKGSHINHDDWNRGAQVDWHAHHLRQPPRGYEWREVDGNYVLAAVATGIIASVIIASSSH